MLHRNFSLEAEAVTDALPIFENFENTSRCYEPFQPQLPADMQHHENVSLGCESEHVQAITDLHLSGDASRWYKPVQIRKPTGYVPEQSGDGVEVDGSCEELPTTGTSFGVVSVTAKVQEPVPTVSIGLLASAAPENHLVVHVSVCGRFCDALIDTGATTSMISGQWLRDNYIDYLQSHSVSISGFGAGNVLRVVGRAELAISLCRIAMPLQGFSHFSVVEAGRSGAIALILAEDFLQCNGMTIDISNHRLRLVTHNEFIDFYANEGRSPMRIVRHVACAVAVCIGMCGCSNRMDEGEEPSSK